MTRYAIDPHRNQLVQVVSTPRGDIAADIASLPAITDERRHHKLATALTELSSALWRSYTDPASAAMDDLSVNSEGERREGEREAFDGVLPALRNPNPSECQSYVRTVEAAHQVGRLLQQIGSTDFTDMIAAEVDDEIRAVERAEAGDLTGRAAQAVLLSRASASPTQVAAALELLDADPFGSRELLEHVDPTSASVAAAVWLLAAAHVAARLSGTAPESIIMEADDIEALPIETPTEVLGRLTAGDAPYEIVSDLIRIAMAVGDGHAVAPQREPVMFPLHDTDSDGRTQLTYLDPRRPAPDLLEDLLAGIHGAFLVWSEYTDEDDDEPDEDADDHAWDSYTKRRRTTFAAHMRQLVHDTGLASP